MSLLVKTLNQPIKFRTKNQVQTNDDLSGTCNTNSQIKFKTSMLRSSLCDYSDVYVLVSGAITITGAGDNDAARRLNGRNKGVTFKNCAPFTDCISEINNTQIDNAKYIHVVMSTYNLNEYSHNYLKTSGNLWQYPNYNITESESFKYKIKITGKSPAAGNIKDIQIVVPLKYLSRFWKTLDAANHLRNQSHFTLV